MKTSRFLSSLAVSMMSVARLQAGGVGPGVGIGIGNAGGPAVSGGHAASVSNGGTHVSAAPVGHAAISSPRAAIAPNHSAAPRYLPGGFTPNVYPNSLAATRAGISRGAVNPASMQPGTAMARPMPVAPAARAHNAWTDAAANNGQTVGTHLYPDATHDALGNPYPGSGRNDHGARWSYQRPFRFHGRGYYGPYIYGYPGVFVGGGYDPYAYGGTASIADTVNGDNTVADSSQPSPEAQNELSRPYATAQATLPAGDSTVNAPDAAPADRSVQPGNGPDSLVEAVQAELTRRGYFGGKIDAVYNDATHTAIQRFQQDQKLPASGRINEATLHALQLD